MVISRRSLEKVYRFHEQLDQAFFQNIFNRFMIMEGISPDVPIGMNIGMANVNGIWQPAIKYSQYAKWEDRIAEDFGDISKSGFGKIRKSPN